MKRSLKATGVAAVSALLLAGCNGNGAADQEGDGDMNVTVGVATLPIFTPVFVADAKGYFEDRGLNVELETIQTGQDAIPLLSSGQLDAVAAGFAAGIFSGLDSGLEFRVVGSMGVAEGVEFSPAHLLVRDELTQDGTVESTGDLRGLNIGVAGGEGGSGAFLTALALEEAGLELEDVNLVNIDNPDIPAALQNGGIDAGLTSTPFSENILQDGIGQSLWHPPEGTSASGLLYGEHFVEEEAAQLFFDALAEASRDLQGDARYTDEYLEIIAEATDQPTEALQDMPLYTWLPDLAPLPDQLTKMESVWMISGALEYDSPLETSEYIDPSFADNVSGE